MAELAIDVKFLQRYARLQQPAQRAVDAAILKFSAHTHAGLHLEKLTGARDPHVRTIRITQFFRGVVLKLGDNRFVLHDVLPHDDAIAYAKSRVFSVNSALGVLEVRDQAGIEALERTLPAVPPSAGVFDGVATKDLVALGVAADLVPLLRRISSDQELEALARLLPRTQEKVLTGLGAGLSVEEVFKEIADQIVSGADQDDLEAAARRTPDRIKFVDGPVELAAILAKPFDAWRVFLHPAQHHVAYRESYSGPALVTGSAGTGKTVTGLHRATLLARRLPDGSRVLLTTYTRALAEALRRQLFRLTDDRAVLNRIDVISIDRLAYDIAGKGRRLDVVGDDTLQELFAAAAAHGPTWVNRAGQVSRRGAAFLRREWEQVILAQRLTTADAYMEASRKGRGDALRAPQREQIWTAIQTVVNGLAKQRLWTHLQIADRAAAIVSTQEPRYRHIVVDEGQDLHPAQWRLLRALVRPGPDDLFILADPHQRIYDSQVSLSRLGIDVRGRAHRLTVNYRTTHEILRMSIRVLSGQSPIGLDGVTDTLRGYQAVTHGGEPEVRQHRDRESEFGALIERLDTWLDGGVEPDAIGIAARNGQLVKAITKALDDAGIDVADDKRGIEGVRVTTMHGTKGLEFQCLAVVGLDAGVLPAPAAVTAAAEDPHAHEHDMQRERCLFFVAMTRARDVLYLSHTGAPSSLLAAVTS